MGSYGRDLGAEKQLSGGKGMAVGVKETEEELGRGPGKGGSGMRHCVVNRVGLLSLEHRVWSRPVELTSYVTLASSLASRRVNPKGVLQDSLGAQMVKNLPVMQETRGKGNGYPLQCSCLENPWTEEAGGLQLAGSQSWT